LASTSFPPAHCVKAGLARAAKALQRGFAGIAFIACGAHALVPAGHFKTEEQVKKYCPNDVVVRVDLSTRRFYAKGHFLYQSSGSPTFECRREALQEGNVPG